MENDIVFRMQIGLFFVDLLRNPNEVAEKITENLGNIFEKYEGEYPLNIYPFVSNQILRDNNKSSSLTFTPERMDYICYRLEEQDINLETFIADSLEIAKETLKCKPIGRIGIITYIFRNEKKPTDYISQNYFKNNILKNPQEISFRYNVKSQYKDTQINNITSFETVKEMSIDNKKENGIIITRDINCNFKSSGISYEFIFGLLKEYKQEFLSSI